MDFGWTPAQDDLYAAALLFARKNLAQRRQAFTPELFRRLGEQGLLGLCIPSKFGGMGLGALSTVRVVEAFGRGAQDAGILFAACAHLFACAMPIAEHAPEALASELLPRLARGELVGANAITEAEAGSDVFALRTRAVRDGEDYVLTGTKTFVSNGPVSDVILTYAVTEPKHGYLGISAFAVDASTPGVLRGEPFTKSGLVGSPLGQIYFEGCRVPATRLVGEEGGGAALFNVSMRWERCCLFAIYVGAMESQLARVTEHAQTRRQGGHPIGKYQAVAHRIADMKLRLETSRLMLYRAAWAIDAGADATLDTALSKLAISEAALQSSLDATRIFGGMGAITETGLEQGVHDALASLTFSGTNDIQRNLIATRLGL